MIPKEKTRNNGCKTSYRERDSQIELSEDEMDETTLSGYVRASHRVT